jgi:hypothetical protein
LDKSGFEENYFDLEWIQTEDETCQKFDNEISDFE